MKGTLRQAFRFAIVGILSNAVGFGWYVLLTWLGLGPKTAMSLLFFIGTLQTFIFNKRWSFEHEGRSSRVVLRYLAAYGIGYLINLAALIVLVEHARYPHHLVQGVMIIVVAIITFLLQKFWVFQQLPKSTYHTTTTIC